ncbi:MULTISPECIES: threonine/serine exporter family protein [Fusobacterium]|jgi:uncharacterized membrane protein YjjP (DUF1212 family)|uniref:threonine/serine ThrE exporter family protein n=1 Tax=Fusobacterium TaxID=848 RepID=UPI000C701A2F|nr:MULTISPECIES: threonine/serine exporter family protein [Fusobacterium]
MEKKFEFKLLNLAADVGEALLKNGSEIYRVEYNVCKVAKRFGYEGHCFATLTCIIISIESDDGEITSLVRRVNSRDTNLDKVYKVARLIDQIDSYDMKDLKKLIKNIDKEKSYSTIVDLAGHCIGAAFFTILFLGNTNEFIAAFIAGLAIGIFIKICSSLEIGTFFTNLICGFVATSAACFFRYTGFIDCMSTTTISALMILVPGVPFINSMRDIFAGDLVTGISRFLEVVMVGTSIAVGSGIALNIFLKFGGIY